jgi:predicted solute-binding protein
LSLTVGVNVTTALLAHVLVVMLAGQVIVGLVVSVATITLNEALAVLPDASVAVQVTVLVPCAKAVPLAGVQL